MYEYHTYTHLIQWYDIHQANIPANHQGRVAPRPQTIQEMYAASKESFSERIKEELNIEIIQAPLTRKNYKEKFHHMICWEEKTHIDILAEK